jgi:hypothetical protein
VVGKPYWVAARLWHWAVTNWRELDGIHSTQGVDLARLCVESPSRFLSAIYVIWMAGRTEQERAQADFELDQPPAWEVDAEPSPELLAADAAAFMAAAAGLKHGRA